MRFLAFIGGAGEDSEAGARAKALADKAKIDNISYIESSFDELSQPTTTDLPDFDYVTLHGVYSWTSPENRHAIVRFLKHRLKPGGAVYVSYNCMPAWSNAIPIQRLLYKCAGLTADRSDRRFLGAFEFARKLAATKAVHFRENEIFELIAQLVEQGQVPYLAHEYLQADWTPLFHIDVARDLEEAKLSFVGTARILENFIDLTVTTEQRGLLNTVSKPEIREMLKDYCLRRRFRQDVFVRGPRRLSPDEREHRLRQLCLALIVSRSEARLKISAPLGELQMKREAYDPVFDVLAQGPQLVKDLVDLPGARGGTDRKATEVTGMLIGSGQALPALGRGAAPPTGSAERFNRAISERTCQLLGSAREAVAAPLTGTGLYANTTDRLIYAGLAAGLNPEVDALEAFVWKPIADRGESLKKGGTVLQGETENLAELRQQIADFLDRCLPIWQQLGAI